MEESLQFDRAECGLCGGHIDFPIQLGATEIDCPHCQQRITLPEASKKKAPSPKAFVSLHGSATPKQIAFLSYLGVSNAECLTKQQATEEIERLLEVSNGRQNDWLTDRLRLYPNLYSNELAEHLSEQLHAYVRSRVVGASEQLTKAKIKGVVMALSKENGHWWEHPDHKSIFYNRLQQVHPGCCDGRTPEKPPKSPKPPKQLYQGSPAKGSGCLVLVSAILGVLALSMAVLIFLIGGAH